MLIVLTSEQELPEEAAQINTLFENGLEVLHLRKPSFDKDGYRTLLRDIDTKFYRRIMIHQYHELCEEFGLRGVHLQEQPRWDLKDGLSAYVASYTQRGFKVSSSFHSTEEIIECPTSFEYVLLSPVFGSISKVGYEAKNFQVKTIKAKVVGMGGINEKTIPQAFELGYQGVGVLGGVWNTSSSEESFLKLLDSYDRVAQ